MSTNKETQYLAWVIALLYFTTDSIFDMMQNVGMLHIQVPNRTLVKVVQVCNFASKIQTWCALIWNYSNAFIEYSIKLNDSQGDKDW